MLYETESDVKMVLGLNAWRNLLNDKITRFADMMPEMKTSLMLGIVSQLPQFWHSAREILKELIVLSDAPDAKLDNQPLISARFFLDRDLDEPESQDNGHAVHLEAVTTAAVQLIPALNDNQEGRHLAERIIAEKSASTRIKLIALLVYLGNTLPQTPSAKPV